MIWLVVHAATQVVMSATLRNDEELPTGYIYRAWAGPVDLALPEGQWAWKVGPRGNALIPATEAEAYQARIGPAVEAEQARRAVAARAALVAAANDGTLPTSLRAFLAAMRNLGP